MLKNLIASCFWLTFLDSCGLIRVCSREWLISDVCSLDTSGLKVPSLYAPLAESKSGVN